MVSVTGAAGRLKATQAPASKGGGWDARAIYGRDHVASTYTVDATFTPGVQTAGSPILSIREIE